MCVRSSGNDWRSAYAGWPEALKKLEYCDRVMRELGDQEPVVTALDLFNYLRDQTQSWSQATRPTAQTPILLPADGGRERAEGIVVTAKVGSEAGWPEATSFVAPFNSVMVVHTGLGLVGLSWWWET